MLRRLTNAFLFQTTFINSTWPVTYISLIRSSEDHNYDITSSDILLPGINHYHNHWPQYSTPNLYHFTFSEPSTLTVKSASIPALLLSMHVYIVLPGEDSTRLLKIQFAASCNSVQYVLNNHYVIKCCCQVFWQKWTNRISIFLFHTSINLLRSWHTLTNINLFRWLINLCQCVSATE